MQIIIPMSGLGKRFADAGYQDIKPLIKINGKTIIEYVISLFPGNHTFIFICRNEHLETTNMKSVLLSAVPNAQIISIAPHKLGPVYAVSKVFELINDHEPVITNYCDFYMHWDFNAFEQYVKTTNSDGCIPCYTGFHPHLLHEKNVYASCSIDSKKNVLEIREKYSFEKDKTKAFHSAGTYYFKNGAIVKKYFTQLMEKNIELNGEFYISLVYNELIKDKLKVTIFDQIPHFCQWGTPEDLEEYLEWEKVFN